MSETFNPDDWPRSTGAGSGPGSNPAKRNTDDGDQFDPLTFDDPQQHQGGGFGPSAYGNVPYTQDDTNDYATFGGAPAYGAPAYDSDAGVGAPGFGGNDYANQDYGYNYGDDANYDPNYDAGETDEGEYGYDNFDDREPRRSGGIQRKLIGLVALIGIAGALFFLISHLLGGNKSPKTTVASSTNATSVTTLAPSSLVTPPADVQQSLNNALMAWARFAADGNLEDVRPYFVEQSDQFNKFQNEASVFQANPVTGSTYQYAIDGPKGVKSSDNKWIVQGPVTVSRTGFQSQKFNWRFTLIRQSTKDPWVISEVHTF